MRLRALIVSLAVASTAGCFNHVEDVCATCQLVRFTSPSPPVIPEGKRALVVLLHGAFGFGSEWLPITRALETRPDLGSWAFVWPGPFGGEPPRSAEAFRVALQRSLDSLPSTAHEVLVLAHSAGGAVADYAARHVRVPSGVKLHIALLDSARISVAPYKVGQQVDTPLGFALGTTQDPVPEIPPDVDIVDYRANDPPRGGRVAVNHWPSEVGVVAIRGEKVVYLGSKVTHGGSVALVGLPLLERLARPPSGDAPLRGAVGE